MSNELGNTPADKNYKPSGISRAEERALEVYPNMTFPFTPLDLNAYRREAFIQGYERAEKDTFNKAKKWLVEIHRVCDITDENGYRIELRDLVASFEKAIKDEL